MNIQLYCHDYQIGYYNMYDENFSDAYFADSYPNFNLHNGCGRIIMVQWNSFMRKIKNHLWLKKKNKKNINLFWKKSRKYALKKYTNLPINIINNIIEYSN